MFTQVTGKDKEKQLTLIFYAKEVQGSANLEYRHTLPKYTTNTDSVVKVANFMIEYCLALNDKYKLYMDNESYNNFRNELRDIQNITFNDPQPQIGFLVPTFFRQNKAARVIQR